jgi:hypothetical protein
VAEQAVADEAVADEAVADSVAAVRIHLPHCLAEAEAEAEPAKIASVNKPKSSPWRICARLPWW